MAALEAAVTARDNEIDVLKTKILALKEDYTHNLRLFEERDAEIDRLERDLASSQQTSREVSTRADRLLQELSTLQARADGERTRTLEMEALHASELRRIRETLDAARSARDEDVRHWREQLEQVRIEAAAALRSRDTEAHEERRQLLEAGDAAVESIRRDSKRREDELSSLLRSSEQRLTEQRNLCNELSVTQSSLAAKLEAAINAQRVSENDLTEMRASMHTLRSDLSDKLSSAIVAKEAALKAKAAITDEYEEKMNNVVESLRSVEAEFQAQGRRFEIDLKAQSAQSQSRITLSEEHARGLEAAVRERQEREKELMAVLKESEMSCQRASERVLYLESQLKRNDLEFTTFKNEKDSILTTMEVRLSESTKARSLLEAKLDDSDHEIAKIRADKLALELRIEEMEGQMSHLNASWEKRWTSREQLALAAQEEEAKAVKGLREELDRQLQLARDAVACNDKRSLLSGKTTLPEESQTETSMASGVSLNGGASSTTASTDSLLMQLASLESDRNGLMIENTTLKENLQQAKSQAFAHNVKLEQVEERLAAATLAVRNQVAAEAAEATATAEMEAERLRRRCGELEAQTARFREVISDMRKHVEDLHAQHDVAMKRQTGVLVSSVLSNEHDDDKTTLPQTIMAASNTVESHHSEEKSSSSSLSVAFVDGMNSNTIIGGKSEELAEAAAYKASAEVMLASLASERDELSAGLTRLQNYVALLQSRVQALSVSVGENGSASADEEILLLRTHTKEQQVALASTRFTLRRTQQELAKLKGTHVYELSRRGSTVDAHSSTVSSSATSQANLQSQSIIASQSSSDQNEELVNAQTEVSRLREERARLLEVSNNLRGQLNRAEQTIASLSTNSTKRVASSLAQGQGHQHNTSTAVALRPNPNKANSITYSHHMSTSSNVEEITVPASRLALLEDSLAKVMRHNAQLSDNLTRILADHHQQQQVQLQAIETVNNEQGTEITTPFQLQSSSSTGDGVVSVGSKATIPLTTKSTLTKPSVPKQAPLSAALSIATSQITAPIPPPPSQQQQQQQQSAVAIAARAKMVGRTVKSLPTNYAELKNV